MPYQSRTPSIKVIIDNVLFNKLLGILDFNIGLNVEDENFSKVAQSLKDKLLTYSVPRDKEDDDTKYVEVRFFPNEASNIIWQLLIRASSYIEEEDYYNLFIEYEQTLENRKRHLDYLYSLFKANARVALMCFEKNPQQCHRHVIRDYFIENYEIRSIDL